MVRTMRISFLALGLLGLYTHISCAEMPAAADAIRTGMDTGVLASARDALGSAGNVLCTVNSTLRTYFPIIAVGAYAAGVSFVGGISYLAHRRDQLRTAYYIANDKLNAARQELIACRTWADQWCVPALNTLNVEREILDNPATWTVYCQNLSTDRVLACVRYLSNTYYYDPTVLLCKLTAEYNHATQAFAMYQNQYNVLKKALSKISGTIACPYQSTSSQQHDIEYGYSTVMVPVYLRKIEFLKTLITTRSACITASAKNQYCTSCCTSACNA